MCFGIVIELVIVKKISVVQTVSERASFFAPMSKSKELYEALREQGRREYRVLMGEEVEETQPAEDQENNPGNEDGDNSLIEDVQEAISTFAEEGSVEEAFLELTFEYLLGDQNVEPVLEAFEQEGFDLDPLREVFDKFFDTLDEGILGRLFGTKDKSKAKEKLMKAQPVLRVIGGGGKIMGAEKAKRFKRRQLGGGKYAAAGGK